MLGVDPLPHIGYTQYCKQDTPNRKKEKNKMFDMVECLDCGEVWTDNGKYCPTCESPNNDWLENLEPLTA